MRPSREKLSSTTDNSSGNNAIASVMPTRKPFSKSPRAAPYQRAQQCPQARNQSRKHILQPMPLRLVNGWSRVIPGTRLYRCSRLLYRRPSGQLPPFPLPSTTESPGKDEWQVVAARCTHAVSRIPAGKFAHGNESPVSTDSSTVMVTHSKRIASAGHDPPQPGQQCRRVQRSRPGMRLLPPSLIAQRSRT